MAEFVASEISQAVENLTEGIPDQVVTDLGTEDQPQEVEATTTSQDPEEDSAGPETTVAPSLNEIESNEEVQNETPETTTEAAKEAATQWPPHHPSAHFETQRQESRGRRDFPFLIVKFNFCLTLKPIFFL